MPTTEVKFDDRHEAEDGIIDLRHWKESLWVSHEAEDGVHC